LNYAVNSYIIRSYKTQKIREDKMTKSIVIIALCIGVLVAGCAILEPVKPQEVLKNPFGTGPLKQGMRKEEIRSMWGEPDVIIPSEESADLTGTVREEWVYQARYSRVPIDTGYVSKTKRLFFDGENLTSWKNE